MNASPSTDEVHLLFDARRARHAVVAAETRDSALHRVARHRGIHGGDAVLERRVELLQFSAALLFGFGVV